MMEWWNDRVIGMIGMGGMRSYSDRHNVNRGYMKLDVWQEAIELVKLIHVVIKGNRIDLRLASQLLDATQSVSANIPVGYGRKSLNDYLRFLDYALGSSGKVMSRLVGSPVLGVIDEMQFEDIDKVHFSLENKLISLIRSLQAKRRTGSWKGEFS
jgi:four helix bundle protein